MSDTFHFNNLKYRVYLVFLLNYRPHKLHTNDIERTVLCQDVS